MYTFKHFKPSEVRAGAREIMEANQEGIKSKEEIAQEIGCTVENLWTACRQKKSEDLETMRGIPTCVLILKVAGVDIDEIPRFEVKQILFTGETSSISPPNASRG